MSFICENNKHLEIETDGTVYCQHCYWDAQKRIKQLEDAGIRVVEMTYLIDESMDEKDMNNLLDSINALEKAVEQK